MKKISKRRRAPLLRQKIKNQAIAILWRWRYWSQEEDARRAFWDSLTTMAFAAFAGAMLLVWAHETASFTKSGGDMDAYLCVASAIIAVMSAWKGSINWLMAKSKGGSAPLKNKLETRIAELRGAAKAQREAQQLREEIGLGAAAAPKLDDTTPAAAEEEVQPRKARRL